LDWDYILEIDGAQNTLLAGEYNFIFGATNPGELSLTVIVIITSLCNRFLPSQE